MKVEFEIHDSRFERPEASCKVLVFHASGLHFVHSASDVGFSSKHDQFNNYDEFPKSRSSYGEKGRHRMYWAYFKDVQEAIRRAVNDERRKTVKKEEANNV